MDGNIIGRLEDCRSGLLNEKESMKKIRGKHLAHFKLQGIASIDNALFWVDQMIKEHVRYLEKGEE